MSEQSLQVKVGSYLHLAGRDVPVAMLEELRARLSRTNPERIQRDKLGLSMYDVPAQVTLIKEYGTELLLPRGSLAILRAAARDHSVKLEFVSGVTKNSVGVRSLDQLPIKLRDYQCAAVQLLLTRVQGYVTLPCGGGKTVIGCAAMVTSGEACLILVHSNDLRDQWAKTLQDLYNVRATIIKGPFQPLQAGEIAIGMVQGLHRAGKHAKALYDSVGVVLLDECHHCPATTFLEIIEQIPARHRWGLTATPDRPDGWGFLLPMVIGPEVYRLSTQELLEKGHLVQPVVVPIRTGINLNLDAMTIKGRLNMGRCVSALCSNDIRNKLLVDLCEMGANNGRVVMLLVPRVKMAHSIANRLQALDIDAAPITGHVAKQIRASRLRALRSGTIQVIVATQLADEGLDIPTLDMLVIASTGRAAGRAVQRIGRIMRPSKGKPVPIVVEVIDGGPFASQWRARERAYMESAGITIPRPVPIEQALSTVERLFGQVGHNLTDK